MGRRNSRRGKLGFVNILLVLVVIVLAFMLVGGVSPGNSLPKLEDKTEKIIDESSLPSGLDKEALQLGTFKFKECIGTVTINLLLDRSGSMNNRTPSNQTKISRLKEAVIGLSHRLSDDSVIGFQSFASTRSREDNFAYDVPISFYKDVKNVFDGKVNALDAEGGTPTHNALAFAHEKIAEAIPRFPDRKFTFIFVSDGAPCPGVGCSSQNGPDQDPRLYNPNPADQIKALGVNVYTLAIYDGEGQADNPALANLMKSISTNPDTHYFEARSADDTSRLLSEISVKICQ